MVDMGRHRGDNVNMALVEYRTTDVSHKQYIVVPTIWLSDLLRWLTLSESAEVIGTSHNCRDEAILPIKWPSYQTCRDDMRISDAMNSVL